MGKIKVAIAGIAVTFLGFVVLVIAVIQDYLAHEYKQFDIIVSYLVKEIFPREGSNIIGLFQMIILLEVYRILPKIEVKEVQKANETKR